MPERVWANRLYGSYIKLRDMPRALTKIQVFYRYEYGLPTVGKDVDRHCPKARKD